ncbi:Gfo/Idh/MocA family oxidoreductase [Luteimicrobium xylanilyticum]|uniref:Inositol 2-dehydrogenase n=1 Tax=Luteimicrobium xylanilyticum TaxID=1133546 RepID=A0A5P9QFK7_9MICO|nr:Gfo/Idh/MocA family oxidoreductase [Luteimicrobium xylanilyticum]QFV00017.1 Inositol 2-dehydrogenase [Luteimicrobium xylanilyticum]
MTSTRYALIGYGGAGRGIHSRLIREAGGVVTDVVARDPGRRMQAASDWPAVRLHDDVASLLASRDGQGGRSAGPAFDVVVVASPTPLHAEHAEAVAAVGVPFVLDKPIATSAAQARRVVAAAGSTPFTVFQNRRWDPEQLTLGAVVGRGELGEVHTFERRWERFRPVPRDRWKENDPVGGGLLLDLGPHLVDAATQLFGPVTAVSAHLRALTTPTEDDVFLELQHAEGGAVEGAGAVPGGVVSRLWAGSVVGAPGPRTRVLGRGAAYLVTTYETASEASPFEVLDADAPAGSEGWLVRGREKTAVPRAPGGHADFYRLVAAWATGEGPAPVDPADAVRTAEVLDAARVAAREGRRVEV